MRIVGARAGTGAVTEAGAGAEAAVLRFCVWFCLYCDNNKMWVGGLNLDLALSVCPTIIGKAEKKKKQEEKEKGEKREQKLPQTNYFRNRTERGNICPKT